MSIKIHGDSLREQLVIETSQGKAKVSVDFNGDLIVEGETILSSVGLTVKDALALFFDRAAKPATKARYPNFSQGSSSNNESGPVLRIKR